MRNVRSVFVTILAVLSLIGLGAGVAHAKDGAGTTRIQNNTGLLTVYWNATSQQSFNSVGGEFQSGWNVGNPRMDVRLLDDQNNEVGKFEQSWTGERAWEKADFPINLTYPTPVSRVCASLYEAGGLMDTACSPVTF